MTPDPDAIADCVLATFDQLPDKRKPRPQSNGAREWVPLAGIVISDKNGKLSCVSLGTGMKCLPSNKLHLAKGNALHDWHAEVLAIRAFNCFLLDELLLILTPPHPPSQYLRQTTPEERTSSEAQPFTLRDDIRIHMYCSEAPCGDASMELTMSLQADATPWTSPICTRPKIPKPLLTALRGRSHFSHLGLVRCKPSRPDAPPTLSKSCTDKLALHQATSLLSGLTSLLISPRNAYLQTLVLPASQHVPSACERAFSSSGRMAPAVEKASAWDGGYLWRPFSVLPTSREFAWSRRMVPTEMKAMSSNLSAVWTPGWQESLIGGVLQGRKQFDPRGASRICRRGLWEVAVRVAGIVGVPALVQMLGKQTYAKVKEGRCWGRGGGLRRM
ncbi:uncharacterized protein N0V89_001507 [Didymosphaeria variabile]|uniref:A to I editase domain-containing protein n=1 Tax=Didymosphaeria variabile TaxID=1932322 RepID=A0A9W8XXC0_9PLEO|nr:uncharacterized protein N0V89_001507 [Didymosphaeria variabile]KAJ4360938.1 hypothetical protein N0V89_001507 [Didymosphaeria variabile]